MQCTKSSPSLNLVRGAVVAIVLLSAFGASASTFNVLWSFGTNGFYDASEPGCNGLVFDAKGNIYGATSSGGENNSGAVFEASPNGQGGWTETVLYSFNPYSTTIVDGYRPCGSLAIDKNDNLYGTTLFGGTNGTGTVYELSPPAAGSTDWTETILYNFGAAGSNDGYNPYAGVTLTSSAAIAIYGTTLCGGTGPAGGYGVNPPYGCSNGSGTVYELSYKKATKKASGGWKETVLYSFASTSSTDGALPQGAVALKGKNLYGVTLLGGSGAYCLSQGYTCGIAYELQPGVDGWTESALYNFGATATDSENPGQMTPVIVGDNIYGTASYGGTNDVDEGGDGTVWELVYSPSDNTYSEQLLYSLNYKGNEDGCAPNWGVVAGKKANTWYGTTTACGEYASNGGGTLFELAYNTKTKAWTETNVVQFPEDNNATYGAEAGNNQLIADKSGNLYGMSEISVINFGATGDLFEFQP